MPTTETIFHLTSIYWLAIMCQVLRIRNTSVNTADLVPDLMIFFNLK